MIACYQHPRQVTRNEIVFLYRFSLLKKWGKSPRRVYKAKRYAPIHGNKQVGCVTNAPII
jgi:hypothetical protein